MGKIAGIKYMSIALVTAAIVGLLDTKVEKWYGFGMSKTIWGGIGLALAGIGIKTESSNMANIGGGVLMFDLMDVMYELTRHL